ncbi:MAG TPA: aldo/keto reductase [Chthoniobacterales bacterium]|nr:aldo/keto reductase [Chthoniobacterales bacterium]
MNTKVKYRTLGKTGLLVSPIALGTMQFGWSADEATSHLILSAYVDAGGNLIDTADVYSVWAPNNPGGVSEEIIGRWLKATGNRDRVLVATKVRGAMGQNFSEGDDHPLQREGLSRRWILRACEDSLRRLQVDYIDLYQAHFIDPRTPIEETLAAFTDLVRKGWVRYIGCSNFSAWRLMQALWASDKHDYESFVSIQPEYSPVAPIRANFERELAPVCLRYGIGVLPYSPLAGGFLTGKYRRNQEPPASVRAEGNKQRMSEQNFDLVEKIVEIAQRHNSTPARVTLAWVLAQPFVTAPIIGANSVEQLTDSIGAADLVLAAEEIEEISKVAHWEKSRTDREA